MGRAGVVAGGVAGDRSDRWPAVVGNTIGARGLGAGRSDVLCGAAWRPADGGSGGAGAAVEISRGSASRQTVWLTPEVGLESAALRGEIKARFVKC